MAPLTSRQVAKVVAKSSGKRLLLNHNLHSAYLHDIDRDFAKLYEQADLVIIDGTPIRWLAALAARKHIPAECRVSSTDWLSALPQTPTDGSPRMFVFGASAISNGKAVEALRSSLTEWTVSGLDGYVCEEDAVRSITEFRPDVVIVGLGMPRQEYFLLKNWDALPDAVYATVGGAIDYVAGETRLAPRWLGRLGIEWAWRLLHEPSRLAYRYLVEPLLLARRVVARSASRRLKLR